MGKRETTTTTAPSEAAEALIAISRTDSTSESDSKQTVRVIEQGSTPKVATVLQRPAVAFAPSVSKQISDAASASIVSPSTMTHVVQTFPTGATLTSSSVPALSASAVLSHPNGMLQGAGGATSVTAAHNIQLQRAMSAIANENTANVSMLQQIFNASNVSGASFPSFTMASTSGMNSMQHQAFPGSTYTNLLPSPLVGLVGQQQQQPQQPKMVNQQSQQQFLLNQFDQQAALTPSTSEPSSVRHQEIEKALLSEPQRGRKRANLNDVERLELTRTRNREHAKSTRIRKKARYEELLDCERQLQEHTEQQELETNRRQCILDFLVVRERMLRIATQGGSSIDIDYDQASQDLLHLVEDASTLSCQKNLHGTSSIHENVNTLNSMKQFDGRLAAAVNSQHHRLAYQVVGAHDDIAISAKGVALVEVMVLRQSGNESSMEPPLLELSALLRIQFAPNSNKIQALAFTVMMKMHKEQQDLLNAQMSYPSVVSLDIDSKERREVCEKKLGDVDECAGPGMTI